jgi:hypothetical protein
LLLQYLGFMHCKDICEPLFHPADKMTESAWGLQGDSFSFDETLGLLCKLSLMKRNDKGGACTYEIHNVVHTEATPTRRYFCTSSHCEAGRRLMEARASRPWRRWTHWRT